MARGMISEFNGEDGRSGIAKKPVSALTPSEKLRLGYTTGVDDPDAKPDRAAWLGNAPTIEE